MNLLVDSPALVWAGTGDRRLSRTAMRAMADPANQVFVSVVTRWELMAKQRRHAAFRLPEPFETVMDRAGFTPLPLEFEVPERLAQMPDHHGDPFDRMLVAQALHHDLVLITGDETIRRYPLRTLW